MCFSPLRLRLRPHLHLRTHRPRVLCPRAHGRERPVPRSVRVLRGVLERDGESMRAARSRGARDEDSTGRADLLGLSGRAPHPHPDHTWMSCTGLASLRVDLSPARCCSPLLCSHPRQSLLVPRLPLAPSTAPVSTARRIHQYQGRRALRVCPSRCAGPAHESEGPPSGATLSKACARTRHTRLWNTIRVPCAVQHILTRALLHPRLWILRSAPAALLARCTSYPTPSLRS
jgi:hypothetical protein